MNLEELKKEAAAFGLRWRTVFRDKPVIDGDPRLVALVIAAHGKTDADKEMQDLRNSVGHTDARWQAYLALRNERIKVKRALKYREQTDCLIFDVLADAVVSDTGDGYILTVPKRAFDEWRIKRRAIKEQEPYEVTQ